MLTSLNPWIKPGFIYHEELWQQSFADVVAYVFMTPHCSVGVF